MLVPVGSLAPQPAAFVSHAAEAGLRPLGRRITEGLMTTLADVERALLAVQEEGTEAFAMRGVSDELCRALASAGTTLTIEIGWALTMPRLPIPAVTFTHAQLATLAAAAERLPPSPRRG